VQKDDLEVLETRELGSSFAEPLGLRIMFDREPVHTCLGIAFGSLFGINSNKGFAG
jgi:hypothetical protein